MDLQGLVGPRLTRWCKASAKLKLVDKEDINFLATYCREEERSGTAAYALKIQRSESSKRGALLG